MTVQKLIDHLQHAVASGEALATDLVILVEYDRVHLRPAPPSYRDDLPVNMTREDRPL